MSDGGSAGLTSSRYVLIYDFFMISHRKIAESLGMPTSTVTNILNGTPYYKKETRERVLAAAAQLGYQKNRASIAVKRGRSNLVGVIHFGSSYETANRAIYFLVDAISKHGYDHMVVDQGWYTGNVQRMLDEMIQARVEGVILLGNDLGSVNGKAMFSPESLDVLKRAKVPVVSLYGDDFLDVPLVGDNSKANFFAMARHLQAVGHRRIVFFSLPTSERSTIGRIEGLQMAMEGVGPCHVLDESDFTHQWPRMHRERRDSALGVIVKMDMQRHERNLVKANYELSKGIFASGALPDALMCANDRAACGVFNAAHEMKIRIPGDIAVTGADNDFVGGLSMFRLTTVEMDIAKSSIAAVEMVMQRLKGKELAPSEISFPSRLVLRQSCGRMVGPGEESEVIVQTPLLPELPETENSRSKRARVSSK
jgi:LacI family transcriptional regulator